MIRLPRSTAVALGLGVMLAALSLPAAASGAGEGTWRCIGADGKVLFTNGNCPAGTAKASPFVPAPVVNRIERTGPAQEAPLAANQQPPLEPLLPTGRVDPFVDCKARGGDFDLTARVCHLPPGGTQPWTATRE